MMPQAGLPTPDTPQGPPVRVFTIKEIEKHLEEWRVRLKTAKDGFGNNTVSWCQQELDRWLDELLDARGR